MLKMSLSVSNVESRAMSSVFIGNIHCDVTEEQLKGLFSEIGPVINFRLFGDKNPTKPKVAFCEYKDAEIAIRATRSLAGCELKGQLLRVDLATSEKCRQELESLGSMESSTDTPDSSTDKAPEEISKAVASLPAEQMFELMKQMKMCIENNPQEARNLLLQNPQLAYALLQAQVIMRIVDPKVAVKILNRPSVPTGNLNPEAKGSEQMPTDDPISEGPPSFLPGISAVTNDPASNAVAPVPRSAPNAPVRPPMISGPQIGSGIPNQFSDQDLRGMGDQDLRQLPILSDRVSLHQLPILSDRDMRAPPVMIGGDKDMRQPMGDQDFRVLGIPPAMPENRPFDPRFRNMHGADRSSNPGFERPRPANLDPRTAYDARNPGGPPRVEDPRKASMSAAALNSRLTAAGPALQSLGPNMPNIGAPHPSMGPPMIPDEQEKAALIMQVLQLSDQQISMLPPEQRQSIMVLKEQLARTQQVL